MSDGLLAASVSSAGISHINVSSELSHLRRVFDVSGVLVVGAGVGTGIWFTLFRCWSDVICTWVEADDAHYQQLQQSTADQLHWRLRKDLVASKAEETIFYKLNNSRENGLLSADYLRGIWSNIEVNKGIVKYAVTLQNILEESGSPNYLIIDCLPALALIKSAAEQLTHIDIIVARVVIRDNTLINYEVTYDEVSEYLLSNGFKPIGIDPEKHPALGYAVYVRDYQKRVGELLKYKVKLTNNIIGHDFNCV